MPDTGLHEIPKRTFRFQGVEIDWEERNSELNDIGKIGKELVIEYEKHLLIKEGKEDFANEVHKVLDGEGYDIYSRNIDGTEKRIEVKTTTGNSDIAFPISLTEVRFSECNASCYSLYRVFNLNKKNRVAEFHEYKGNLNQHFLFEGMQFIAFIKMK